MSDKEDFDSVAKSVGRLTISAFILGVLNLFLAQH
jgi:hypothetical protein